MDRALQLMGLHGGDSKKFSILNALITLSRTNDIGTVCLEKGIGAQKDITAAKYGRMIREYGILIFSGSSSV